MCTLTMWENARPCIPEPVAAALSEIAAPDAIFTADTGMCNVWSARHIKATKDRRHHRFL